MSRWTAILGMVGGLVGAVALGGGAQAALYPSGGVTAKDVASVMLAHGYQAEITKDETGDPMVKSAVDGTKFSVAFYGCNHGPRCTALEFLVGFDLPNGMAFSRINKWNKDERFGHAFLDDEKDPYIQLDIDTEVGFTSESLGSYVDTWARLVPKFKHFMNADD